MFDKYDQGFMTTDLKVKCKQIGDFLKMEARKKINKIPLSSFTTNRKLCRKR